jgi:hypothetical protein
LFLGEVLRVPTASEESANGATTFLLAEAHAGAPVGGAGAFLFVALVTGAVATGAEAIAAAFLLGEVLTGAADAGFCFFSMAAMRSKSSASFRERFFSAAVAMAARGSSSSSPPSSSDPSES